jgi:two-component system, chemotaxis family, chemotaxis protein CheY
MLKGLRVLIVDDEPFMCSTIRQMLSAHGRPIVKEAASGQAALELVPTFKPDLVICDHYMSPMNGLELLKALKSHAMLALRDAAVIMVTGNAEKDSVIEALRAGASGYLVKPISPKQLGERLAAVLKERPSGAARRAGGATKAQDARILIVEDEVQLIEAVQSALQQGGFNAVEMTSDPNEVVSICRRSKPDIVLLDLEMPSMGGFDVIEAIRKELPAPHPIVIMMTAEADAALRTRIFEQGAWDYVSKPFSVPELLARVSHAAEAVHAGKGAERREGSG